MRLRVPLILSVGILVLLLAATTTVVLAKGPKQFLFGHNNVTSSITSIDTSSGLGTTVGPTGFSSNASGLATSRGPVPGPAAVDPAGTAFGVLRDAGDGKDYVVVVDTVTGTATKLVQTSSNVGGRGIAFGPDGVTLYLIEGAGGLFTVNTVDGTVSSVGGSLSAVSLQFDPNSNKFFAIQRLSQTLYQVDPADGSATQVGAVGDLGISACTLAR